MPLRCRNRSAQSIFARDAPSTSTAVSPATRSLQGSEHTRRHGNCSPLKLSSAAQAFADATDRLGKRIQVLAAGMALDRGGVRRLEAGRARAHQRSKGGAWRPLSIDATTTFGQVRRHHNGRRTIPRVTEPGVRPWVAAHAAAPARFCTPSGPLHPANSLERQRADRAPTRQIRVTGEDRAVGYSDEVFTPVAPTPCSPKSSACSR